MPLFNTMYRKYVVILFANAHNLKYKKIIHAHKNMGNFTTWQSKEDTKVKQNGICDLTNSTVTIVNLKGTSS